LSTAKQPKADQKATAEKRPTVVSSESLPRRTLADALRIATVIRDNYAGKPVTAVTKGAEKQDDNPVNLFLLGLKVGILK
jgi:hypothetical protein